MYYLPTVANQFITRLQLDNDPGKESSQNTNLRGKCIQVEVLTLLLKTLTVLVTTIDALGHFETG